MVNTEEFVKRLEQILQFYGLSATVFAERVGVQRSSLSHLLSGRNKPSLDFVMKICDEFNEVDLYWFLQGKGQFPKSGRNNTTLQLFDVPGNKISENFNTSTLSSETLIDDVLNEIQLKNRQPINLEIQNFDKKEKNSVDIDLNQNKILCEPDVKNQKNNSQTLNYESNPSYLKALLEDEVAQMIIIFRDGSFKSYKPRN